MPKLALRAELGLLQVTARMKWNPSAAKFSGKTHLSVQLVFH